MQQLSIDILEKIENSSALDAMKLITDALGDGIVFSTSLGQEDQVLTHLICKNNLPVDIFTLDTGRLFNETYDLLAKTEMRYKTKIKIYFPESSVVESWVTENGINAFYDSVENRKACCNIRKVQPLNRALQGAKVWITGLRADQSTNRTQMKMIEWDDAKQLYKLNPLLHWSYDELISYIQQHFIPYNPLHDSGFISIGCAPCTRAVAPGEDIRAGRWWWETSQKECGLHSTKM